MKKVHFWADIPNDWRPSLEASCELHTGEREMCLSLSSVYSLSAHLSIFIGNNVSFEEVDFHTHGSPGCLYINGEKLRLNDEREFPTCLRDLDRAFRPDATITFLGCNVGDKAIGEYFLLQAGRTFLKGGGGTVRASTSVGLQDPLVSGNLWHPTGTWIEVKVIPGGAASLQNPIYLDARRIEDRIQELSVRIERGARDPKYNGPRQLLDAARRWGTGTQRAMLEACLMLEGAELFLANIKAEERLQMHITPHGH